MDHQVVGYDASYYCYIRSRAWADDIYYTFFVEDPMNDTEGRRYRHGVLAKGGSQDTAKILEDYLGRKPSTVAFFSALGLDVYPSSST
jgi:metallopeptidase MepB